MEKLTIDRTKWGRGKGSEDSLLLRPSNGKMCCLGFLSLHVGLSEEDISFEKTPDSVLNKKGCLIHSSLIKLELNKIFSSISTTEVCQELMYFNDTTSLTEEVREERLKLRFLQIGYEVEFIN